MDTKDIAPKEIIQMMISNQLPTGMPVYEDSAFPYRDSETGEMVHAQTMSLPGRGTFLLCSPEFLRQLKENFSEKE